MRKTSVENGKYNFIVHDDGRLECKRYDEDWIYSWEMGSNAIVGLTADLDEARNSTLSAIATACYQTAKDHGFWEDEAPNIPEKLCLIHSEVSEALEDYREFGTQYLFHVNVDTGKPEGFAIELADVIIRVFDLCVHLDIDIQDAVKQKMEYNKTRPYKHGNKKC